MLERHHLAIIRAVVSEGTLTRAAQSLHLTQSALSHAIKKLEERLGIALWQKKGRTLRLTQAGEYLYQRAQIILPHFEHSEKQLLDYAQGKRGSLRIGMECYPCYQWLLNIVSPYLNRWTQVDVDVKQRFQFQGIAALYAFEIDLLITPDPILGDHITFTPVFDYEQVLVVANHHHLARQHSVSAEALSQETLITYPVPIERLDIFQSFLLPQQREVKAHKTIETTEIILEMVAAGRGVTALPRWLIEQQAATMPLTCLTIGQGMYKQIHIGIRDEDANIDYIKGFIDIANEIKTQQATTAVKRV